MILLKTDTARMIYSNAFTKSLIISFALFVLPAPLLAEEAKISHSTADYTPPDVTVVRQDGKKIPFIKEIDDGRPVIMNFIFASCSAICPMISHVLSGVQTQLGENNQKVHLISISIDPENDTPAKLSEYAKKFGAGAIWDYYTGTLEASIAIQKAFDTYRGDKMNHTAVVLMRAAPNKPWLRLEGLMSPDVIIHEYRNLDSSLKLEQ